MAFILFVNTLASYYISVAKRVSIQFYTFGESSWDMGIEPNSSSNPSDTRCSRGLVLTT